uniref:Fibronectin type-III domain-containing protein n=1 Tax=Amphimedon queenslandica TaxID=400682 RepID=A0A1X7UKY6_AMPQE
MAVSPSVSLTVPFFSVVFLSFSSLLLPASGTPQFTNCPSSVCLSQPVSYECSVNTTGGADTLRWTIFDDNNLAIAGVVPYAVNQPLPAMSIIRNDFTANLTDSSGPIVSDISFTPSLSINDYTVECDARGTGSYPAVTCPILIAGRIFYTSISSPLTFSPKGIPDAPVPNDPNFTSDTLTFSWSPSNSTCVSHYNVNVTSIDYTISTNDTSLSLPVPSTNDTEYSISVVAVDTGGRYMNPMDEKSFEANVPEFVSDLMVNQTGLSINISWDEPPTLMFLPVLSYTLHHNVTSDASITILAPNTSYIIRSSVVAGSVYTVGVEAVNTLGTGPIASATISIISTSVPSPTITRMSMTMSPSVTSSTPGGLDSAVYIGIGVGVALIIIVILILIVVGYLVWRKSKGEQDSTEPIALVDKKDHGSSPATGQPIYQEAMSSEDIQREAAPTTGELYAQPSKGSTRRPPPQPQSELATYQDPSTIQRTQAPNMEYLYAEVDKSKPQQQQAVYAQVDKEKRDIFVESYFRVFRVQDTFTKI